MLVASPPGADGAWSYDNLLATLADTFELAKVRTVDRELLDLGQLLPTSYMSQDHFRAAATTFFAGTVRQLNTGS